MVSHANDVIVEVTGSLYKFALEVSLKPTTLQLNRKHFEVVGLVVQERVGLCI